MKFTKQQLDDWWRYEDVRQEGAFNMFDPRARIATKLPKKRYSFVMKNFTELRQLATQFKRVR